MIFSPDEKNLQAIHTASVDLLNDTGICCPDDFTLDLCKKNSIRVRESRVYFSGEQIKRIVGQAPGVFTLYARNPLHNMCIGSGESWFAPSFGAPYIADYDGNKRQAAFSDYVNIIKLVHQCVYFHINGGTLVQPWDINTKHNLPSMLYASLLLSDKCLLGGTGDSLDIRVMMDILKITFGESLIAKPRIIGLINTSSPLQINKTSLETIRIYASMGQPVIITPGPIAGMTGPVTIAGHLAMANAEALAGIAITQMIRPGNPVLYGVQGSNADLRYGSPCVGSPDSALIVTYCAKMAKFYGLPSRSGGTKNDAKAVDVECGYESMMMLMTSCLSNIDLIIHSAGILDSFKSFSYEKFIVDTEIIGIVSYLLNGADISSETLELDSIKESALAGDFLTNDFTLSNFKNAHFKADVGIKRVLSENESPRDILLENIEKEKTRLLDRYTQPEFDKNIHKALKNYICDKGIDIEFIESFMY